MREDRRPRTLATNILERKQPSVAYRNVGYISLLAGMVEQFAERTDFVVTDMAMDMPAEIVGGLIEERRTRDDIAARLSRMIRAEADWLEVVDAETIDADAWAETWMLERD
ncbi:MAG TPA: hypothetical protein VK978_01185 [Candidatus Saccharimonadales bacterium]|nr:hypothetical protein [Candidatus Saccharimonadales bacterium]